MRQSAQQLNHRKKAVTQVGYHFILGSSKHLQNAAPCLKRFNHCFYSIRESYFAEISKYDAPVNGNFSQITSWSAHEMEQIKIQD